MVERLQELNLPNAVVGRLIKDTLPEGISASKEFRMAISRAASVFVIFLSSAATDVAKHNNVKTLSADHIFSALEEAEFESFVQPLKETLETYRKSVKDKKDSKLPSAGSSGSARKSSATTPNTSPSKRNGSAGTASADVGDDDEDVENVTP